MRKRRVNWTRRILGCVFVFCLMSYVALLIVTVFSNNEERAKVNLAQEMLDEQPPVIELLGGESMTMAVGDTLIEPGYIVYDVGSGATLEIEGFVDVKHPGDYEIRYHAYDDRYNASDASRKVKVINPTGRIYLTFDDGPSDYTANLLDILAKYNVKATFFVTGYGDDALIKREYDEGHAIGLHTNSHIYSYVYGSIDNYTADLKAVGDRVQRITGKTTKLMRFPGGSSNMISSYYDGGTRIMSTLIGLMKDWDYSYFDWNVDSNDAGGATTADEVYTNVVSNLKVGGSSVVLQHDTKSYSVEAVERIIQYGLEHNFVFSKLDQTSFMAHHSVNN